MATFQAEREFECELASIARRPRSDLVRMWEGLVGSPPRKGMSTAFLRRALAYELQVRRWGGLNVRTSRQLCSAVHAARDAPAHQPPEFQAGTRLIREWNGREHVVDVTEGGFEWEGHRYPSLSAVARAITGARWSGPRFFGRRDG